MAAGVRLEWHRDAVHALLKSSNGPVVRDLLRRGRRVQTRAKQLCPVDTGRLRSSITVSPPQESRGGVTVFVGSNVDYAQYVESGTSRMAGRHFLRNALSAVSG